MFGQPLVKGQFLFFKVGALSCQQQIPVDLVSVEIRSVDAGELCFAAHGYPAAAAHTGAIDHYRVQADDGLYAEGFGGFGTELHHNARADGDYPVDFLAFKQFFFCPFVCGDVTNKEKYKLIFTKVAVLCADLNI